MLNELKKHSIIYIIFLFGALIETYITRAVPSVFWNCFFYVLLYTMLLTVSGYLVYYLNDSLNKLAVIGFMMFIFEYLLFQFLLASHPLGEYNKICSNRHLTELFSMSFLIILVDFTVIRFFPKVELKYLFAISITLYFLLLIRFLC